MRASPPSAHSHRFLAMTLLSGERQWSARARLVRLQRVQPVIANHDVTGDPQIAAPAGREGRVPPAYRGEPSGRGRDLVLSEMLVPLAFHDRIARHRLEEHDVELRRRGSQPVRGDHVVGRGGIVELDVRSPGNLDRDAIPIAGQVFALGHQQDLVRAGVDPRSHRPPAGIRDEVHDLMVRLRKGRLDIGEVPPPGRTRRGAEIFRPYRVPVPIHHRVAAERHREVAQPVPGPTSEWLASVARARSIWVLGGSVLEAGDDGTVFNTSLLFERSGELVARYRKIHLFDVDLPGQPPIRESFTYSPGEDIVAAQTEFGVAGLSVCYDVRFPELYRALVTRGAEIIFVPSAFTFETGTDHWDVLIRARAIESQAFVLAPAQSGTWGPPEQNRRCFGNSLAVDPWGRVLARAPEGVGVTFADLDLEEVRRVRERLPALRHRRLGSVT